VRRPTETDIRLASRMLHKVALSSFPFESRAFRHPAVVALNARQHLTNHITITFPASVDIRSRDKIQIPPLRLSYRRPFHCDYPLYSLHRAVRDPPAYIGFLQFRYKTAHHYPRHFLIKRQRSALYPRCPVLLVQSPVDSRRFYVKQLLGFGSAPSHLVLLAHAPVDQLIDVFLHMGVEIRSPFRHASAYPLTD
jgi:hypothetical protein